MGYAVYPGRAAAPVVRASTGVLLLAALSAACGGAGTSDTAPIRASSLFAAGQLGGECVVDDDCTTGFCDRTVPGGYCTRPCEVTEECGSAGHCSFGYCFQTCRSQRECRSSEFECYEAAPDVGVCSFVVDSVRADTPNVGAPCRAVVECSAPGELERYCVAVRDSGGAPTGFVGGMCVALGCAHDLDCGEGARCLPGAIPYCAPACESASDCRPGYVCDELGAVCVPPP